MQTDVIFVLAMIMAVAGSVVFLKRIVTASKTKERFIEFGKYAACIAVFFLCAWGFVFTNNLLWYGQNPENAAIVMNINAENVEETSFLYLLEQLDASVSPENVIALMGTDYEENTTGSYVIRYVSPNCTLGGEQPTFVSFTFNKKRSEILQITWSYHNPAPELFGQILEHLETSAMGKASSVVDNKAVWGGLRLENTGDYLLLQRVF